MAERNKVGENLIAKRRQSLSRPSMQLEEHLTTEQFSQLMNLFRSQGRRRRTRDTKITTQEFRLALSELLHRPEDDEKIALLCNKIDTEGEGFIEEDELCTYFLHQFREKDSISNARSMPFQDPPKFRHNMCSKETICRIMQATNPTRHVTVSKDGTAAIWNTSLQFQWGTVLKGALSGKKGKRGALWVTDCTFMNNCNKLVLSTTSREVLFYDFSNPKCKCQYRLHDLPSVVLCTTFYYNSMAPSSTSYLICGDIAGSILIFTFHCPQMGLFASSKKEEDASPLMVGFNYMSEHSQYVSVLCLNQLHPGWVRSVHYMWHNHSFISCANYPINSLIMMDISKKKKTYVFKITKGVLCFDYCHKVDLLVTGSMDHMVRVWNPYVPSKPVAQLFKHSTAVLSVIIANDMGLIFSFSQDSVICAWDMYEHVLIQMVSVKFPFSQRLPDHGPCPLSLLKCSHSLVVLCNEYIGELKVGSVSMQGTVSQQTCHQNPLCAALYNQHFHQVVSGCEGGVIKVWDIDSGTQVIKFSQCHGKHELTAMALDSTGRRLITGSRAGEIKVWNYMNSECVKVMCSPSYCEVTGVMHLLNRTKFISVGWNRRIQTFPDHPDVFDVSPDGKWNTSQPHHNDDILCVAYCPPSYLATGSFDGEIRIWNMDTEKVTVKFHTIKRLKRTIINAPKKRSLGVSTNSLWSGLPSQRSSITTFSSRPASRKLSTYRMRSSSVYTEHVPVDKLQFLQTRMRTRHKGSAVLISSEGGLARFWDIFGKHESLGGIPMSQFNDENVLAMKTDTTDSHLLAGDTQGFISIFDIKNYCTSSQVLDDEDSLQPIAQWRAHDGEILSLDYVPHETQPLVLSASGDCTVRLWTMQGHYVGMFGQDKPWNLKVPATFQHPNTPWGEHRKSNISLPEITQENKSQVNTPILEQDVVLKVAAVPSTQPHPLGQDLHDISVSSISSNTAPLPRILIDKSLGSDYNTGIQRRMAGRHERRLNYAEVNVKATERFGLLCSPYQALQILKVDEISDMPSPRT